MIDVHCFFLTPIFHFKSGQLSLESSIHNGKENVLNLSVDWDNRLNRAIDHSLAVSSSDGELALYKLRPDFGLEKCAEWLGHGFEAWIVGFNYHQPQICYSGGDDCLFKGWDLRVGYESAIFTSKRFVFSQTLQIVVDVVHVLNGFWVV